MRQRATLQGPDHYRSPRLGRQRHSSALRIAGGVAIGCALLGAVVLVSSKPKAVQAASATLSAALVDPEKKAPDKAATVQVTVSGVQIIDPDTVHAQPKSGQGHLHYRLDNGPVIATTAEKLSFHDLSPGQHSLLVMLAGNDHKPLGPQETLTFAIP